MRPTGRRSQTELMIEWKGAHGRERATGNRSGENSRRQRGRLVNVVGPGRCEGSEDWALSAAVITVCIFCSHDGAVTTACGVHRCAVIPRRKSRCLLSDARQPLREAPEASGLRRHRAMRRKGRRTISTSSDRCCGVPRRSVPRRLGRAHLTELPLNPGGPAAENFETVHDRSRKRPVRDG
jgi:hypothetical protein